MRRKRSIQRSWLYRYRYLLASILLAVIVLAISIYRFWSVPSGLSASEKLSAIASGRLASGNVTGLVNAPWLIPEALAIKLYGMTIFALRLPALFLVVASILTMMLAIRAIYQPSLAMMGGLLMACSAFTISLGRAGTPAVMTVLLLTLAILLGYYVVNAKQKVAPAIGLALDLMALSYMSGGLYIVVALAVVTLLHPKSRYQAPQEAARRGSRGLCDLVACPHAANRRMSHHLGEPTSYRYSQPDQPASACVRLCRRLSRSDRWTNDPDADYHRRYYGGHWLDYSS